MLHTCVCVFVCVCVCVSVSLCVCMLRTCRVCRCRPYPQARDNSSKFRGVCLEKKTHKWRAEIQINGKKESLGYHEVEHNAVRTYDRALIVLKGERAKTNLELSEYAGEMEQLKLWTFEQFQATLNTKVGLHKCDITCYSETSLIQLTQSLKRLVW
jgi:hypothetical protein